ncbi:hypothetical protein IXO812_20640 [Xanthomonas oryzae pv. oryzae]|nr:hypothetical protein IXO812_20640 [Xanthomonas oryzae pv. oryzae]
MGRRPRQHRRVADRTQHAKAGRQLLDEGQHCIGLEVLGRKAPFKATEDLKADARPALAC